MKFDNQLRYAVQVVRDYDGRQPLAAWLKEFFRDHKQMGSSDRRTLSAMAFAFYRMGRNTFSTIENGIVTALRITGQLPEVTQYFADRYATAADFSNRKIFPWTNLLSTGIDYDQFSASFLRQPDLFIRTRAGNKNQVLQKLQEASIAVREYGDHCLGMPNATPVDKYIDLNREAVVQDKSSQATIGLLDNVEVRDFWDCCAGGGGKSIMIHDLFPDADITVSDIRSAVMANLRERFRLAGIERFHSAVTDLSDLRSALPVVQTDLVVADVPCTGSGTWSRTPEQLFFFDEDHIARYADRQKKIIDRVAYTVRPGGHLLYITCSVFRQENEDISAHLSAQKNLTLLRQEVIKGYNEKADTMYAALFINEPA